MLSFAVLSTLLRLPETESWSRQFGQATVPFLVSCLFENSVELEKLDLTDFVGF
jgi:hypothetical protein